MIFDNGSETFDRYTFINKNYECYGFSDNPYHPQGFGQYCGEVVIPYIKIGESNYLGERISMRKLNDDCKQFIKERK